jgi:hypothetical protein
MKRSKWLLGAIGVALALSMSGFADARGHGGGGHGGGGRGGGGHSGSGAHSGGHSGGSHHGGGHFRGGGHHFHGFRGGIAFGAPLFIVPGYTYATGYPYYYPPVVAMPPQYIEQADDYRYYCAELGAYFPDVQQCPGQWQVVVPQ